MLSDMVETAYTCLSSAGIIDTASFKSPLSAEFMLCTAPSTPCRSSAGSSALLVTLSFTHLSSAEA